MAVSAEAAGVAATEEVPWAPPSAPCWKAVADMPLGSVFLRSLHCKRKTDTVG